jgi:hypothetical protein
MHRPILLIADFKKTGESNFQSAFSYPGAMRKACFFAISHYIFNPSSTVIFNILQTFPKLRTVTLLAAEKAFIP